jgi:hypothetical protein
MNVIVILKIYNIASVKKYSIGKINNIKNIGYNNNK